MKSRVSNISNILAVVFSLLACASFAITYLVKPFELNGIRLAMVAFGALNTDFIGLYGALFFAALALVLSLGAQIFHWWLKFQFSGIGVGICAVIGTVSSISLLVSMSGMTYPSWHSNAGAPYVIGAGVYVCIAAFVLMLVSAIVGIIAHTKKDLGEVRDNNVHSAINNLNA